MRELITGHCSAGEVWVSLTTSKTIFCTASILRDIPRAKSKSAKKMQRQQGWNPPNIIECDRCNHWFHFKCVNCIFAFILFCVIKICESIYTGNWN